MNTVDFSTWFKLTSYGGLICCAVTLAICAFYTFPLRRGSIRQFIVAIACCIIAASLTLPAFIWFNLRFDRPRPVVAGSEMLVALVYLIICDWVFPLGVMVVYAFFTAPRKVQNAVPSPQSPGYPNPAGANVIPPLYQRLPGVPVPCVFDEETPWGWLEHLEGRLKGQRLALKLSVISLGRGEENDICLDDDMASRHHADLTWNQGNVYVTDCKSLNGVLVQGQRVQGVAPIRQQEILQIGTHSFLFEYATSLQKSALEDDPLLNHIRGGRRLSDHGTGLIARKTSEQGIFVNPTKNLFSDIAPARPWLDTGEFAPPPLSTPAKTEPGAFVILDGELAGKMFPLDRPLLTIGRSFESDVVVNDVSISRLHAQVLRQQDGEYIQDLGSRNGTKANEQPLSGPYRLKFGDHLCLGNIHFDYIPLAEARAANLSALVLPPLIRPNSGVVSLHLPSKH